MLPNTLCTIFLKSFISTLVLTSSSDGAHTFLPTQPIPPRPLALLSPFSFPPLLSTLLRPRSSSLASYKSPSLWQSFCRWIKKLTAKEAGGIKQSLHTFGCATVLVSRLSRIMHHHARKEDSTSTSTFLVLEAMEYMQIEPAGSPTLWLTRNAFSELGTSISRDCYMEVIGFVLARKGAHEIF